MGDIRSRDPGETMDEPIRFHWTFTEQDHLTFAWGVFVRKLPNYIPLGCVFAAIFGLSLTYALGALPAALISAATVAVGLPLVAVQAWRVRRAGLLATVRSRPLTTSPVSASFSASGMVIDTVTARGAIGWPSVTKVEVRHGFLVVEGRETAIVSAPVSQLDPKRLAELLERTPAWRANAHSPPAIQLPPLDAVYDLTVRVETADEVAIAQNNARKHVVLMGSRSSATPLALLSAMGAAGAWAAGNRFITVVAGVVFVCATAVAAAGVWIPIWAGLVVVGRQWVKRPQRGPARLLFGPGGLASIDSEGGTGARSWLGATVERVGRRWVIGLAPGRVVVAPERSFPDTPAFEGFGPQVAAWIRDAPTIQLTPPRVVPPVAPPPQSPWAPARD